MHDKAHTCTYVPGEKATCGLQQLVLILVSSRSPGRLTPFSSSGLSSVATARLPCQSSFFIVVNK